MKKGRMKVGDFSSFRGRFMTILEQYMHLWLQYGKGKSEGEQIEITIQNISETLFCTERNSKLIIKKIGRTTLDYVVSWKRTRKSFEIVI